MTTATEHESWRAVPGFEGFYEISDRGRVRGVHRVIMRRNGVRYTAQPRILRQKSHAGAGLYSVALAHGRRGHYRYLYVHKLVQTVFGDERARP
jgi:hypothetical protein